MSSKLQPLNKRNILYNRKIRTFQLNLALKKLTIFNSRNCFEAKAQAKSLHI